MRTSLFENSCGGGGYYEPGIWPRRCNRSPSAILGRRPQNSSSWVQISVGFQSTEQDQSSHLGPRETGVKTSGHPRLIFSHVSPFPFPLVCHYSISTTTLAGSATMSTSAPSQLPAEYSSRTLTITPTPTPEAGPSNPDPSNGGGPPNVRVLRLRGGPNRRQKVVWSEETVDNEGMGKKRSKSPFRLHLRPDMTDESDLVCCIYHRPKAYDESSSESSSDSEGGKDPEKDERRANGGMDRREKVEGGKGEVEESSESDGGAGKGNAR